MSTEEKMTIDERHEYVGMMRKRYERASQVTRDMPLPGLPWNEAQPGRLEVDLVHRCGSSASGDYVHTVQMIDVATGWSERTAVLGRSYRIMEDGLNRCLAGLPCPVLELHPDNGSEFFNHYLVRFFRETIPDSTAKRPFLPRRHGGHRAFINVCIYA